jgi:hypothetical protein
MNRTRIPGAVLATIAAIALTSCTVNPLLPSVAPSSTPSQPSTTAAVQPIAAADMLNAPVPSLCGHPAGTLTKGSLDAPGANTGGSQIAGLKDGDWQQLSFHAWQEADGQQYAALVMDCNQGGVGWPPHVVFYAAGPTVLGEVNVAKVVGNGRQSVHALQPVTDGIRLSLTNTYQNGEDGCCGTADVIADFTWNGSKATGTQVQRLTERASAKEAFFAALKGDRATIMKLYNIDGLNEALDFKKLIYISDPNKWSQDFSCESASTDQLFDGQDRKYDRVCHFAPKNAYLAAFVAMGHTGFGQWQAAGIQFTTTD